MKQGEVVDLIVENGRVRGVRMKTHAVYEAEAVVIATGTFLGGKIFIGDSCYNSGPNGLSPSVELASNLKKTRTSNAQIQNRHSGQSFEFFS